MDKFIENNKYRFIKGFYHEALPLIYEARKGEIVTYVGRSIYAHFKKINKDIILMTKKKPLNI